MATWQNKQIDVGVVDETASPPKVYKLQCSYEWLAYKCYFCGDSAISMGYLHSFVGRSSIAAREDLDRLIHEFQHKGVRCFNCKRPLALIVSGIGFHKPEFFWCSNN
jgi:hypothetical protein